MPDNAEFDNAFKVQWESFLKHVAIGTPWPHDFLEGAKGVQLADLGLESWAKRCWLDVPPLSLDATNASADGRKDAEHPAAAR